MVNCLLCLKKGKNMQLVTSNPGFLPQPQTFKNTDYHTLVQGNSYPQQSFSEIIQEEIQLKNYFTQKNVKEWGKSAAPYAFYATVPALKSMVRTTSFAVSALFFGIEYLPYVCRTNNPLFDSSPLRTEPKNQSYLESLLQYVPQWLKWKNEIYDSAGLKYESKKFTIIETRFGDVICDENELPLFNEDGSLRIRLLSLTKTWEEDKIAAIGSLFFSSLHFLGIEAFVKTHVVSAATKDPFKGAFFYFYKWQVDRIEEITKEDQEELGELDSSITQDKSLQCQLTKKVAYIPYSCQEGHLFEFCKILAYHLVHPYFQCPVGHHKIESDDLRFDEKAYNKVHEKLKKE
jgi:hypothetical protein